MNKSIPNHVAIILDGNGRWAKKRLLPRKVGHRQGAKNVETICEIAYNLGIKYLTVYAFSTENWKRSADEVEALMNLLSKYLSDYREKAMKNNMRVRIIGNRTKLREDIITSIKEVEELTSNNTGLNFQIAINYGGRDEIKRAFIKMYEDISKGILSKELIDEKCIADYLDTKEIPDPDLIIRTSGEMRISNYLIWQGAYSEYYFTNVLWPDFDESCLIEAINSYSDRERRYGGA